MQPYGVKHSPRPGCVCCNTSDLHKYRNGKGANASVKRAKRAAKKRARREKSDEQ